MKATDFEDGDCISDGNRIGWIYSERGRRAYVCTNKTYQHRHRVGWLDELSGDNWHRLVPECVLTDADRVTDLSTLEDGEQVITQSENGEIWATTWRHQFAECYGNTIYRDSRPMPKIIPAKEKTLEEKVAEIIHNWVLSDASLQTTKIAAEIVATLNGGAT